MNKRFIIIALFAVFAISARAAMPDSIKKELEDYDFLTSFIEKNYAPFDAIMQKGYKGEYKSLKKQIRAQLRKGESDLDKAAVDYLMWFYSQFDRHIGVMTDAFGMAQANIINEAILKMDSTVFDGAFEYEPKPVSCKVDSLTWLIRVPSCHPDCREWIKNALQQFDESGCVNLIVDVRGNDGGDDGVWNKYYDMLYDHPSKPYITWFRNTPENRNQELWETDAKGFIATCKTSKKKYVKWYEEPADAGRKPTARIKRAAILIDVMTTSAGESVVSFVKRHSDRAKVYGIGSTHGSNLTGSLCEVLLPNSKIGIQYATTIDSAFYEKDFSDGIGIAPDVFIPLPMSRKLTDNIDEWVLWVAEDMKRR